MEVKIENYRGWDISFNSEKETFFVESDEWDQKKEKRSFAACKTFVDEYLKANSEFKPIRIQHKTEGTEILLTGIRKDMRFVYEEKGEKKQLSDYYEDRYIVFSADNLPIFEEIKTWKKAIADGHKQVDRLEASIQGKSLPQFKKELYPK